MRIFPCFVLLLLAPTVARAGYEPPCNIDGCRSIDGRFVVTAEPVGKLTNHGPNKWQYIWTDTKEKKTIRFDANEVSSGQVFGHLFVAPDGETFALWNHFVLWTEGKSDMHGAAKLCDVPGKPRDRADPHFSRRLVIYKKDGTVVKSLGVNDILTADEWDNTLAVFNRIGWLVEYPGLRWKETPRHGYAFYRVSPDYTVLEFRVTPPRNSKEKTGRVVRVSLTDGTILSADTKLEGDKLPVRPYRGPDHLPDQESKTREGYIPSLDPVREEGKVTFRAPPPPATLALVKDGFAKLDTPAWLPAEKCLVFTDLESGKLFRLDGEKVSELRSDGGRGKVGPDGLWYGVLGGKLVAWKPGAEPKPLLAKVPGDKELSINDIVVSTNGFLYFTTLKDPERGRVTAVNLKTGAAIVCFDAEGHPELSNPNGIVAGSDGKTLYVAVSNYKDRKKAGIYRFPVREDGSLDVAAGKKSRWAAPNTPDGLAISPDGNVYCTDGNVVRVYAPDGKEVATVKIPRDSGTNLAFGGPDGRTLYVTTNKVLFRGEVADKK
ncbi:MAG: SMP-30/gluconolactonase/LRE family protein [Gemmataceae bacterium]